MKNSKKQSKLDLKKALSTILALMLCLFCIVSCGKTDGDSDPDTSSAAVSDTDAPDTQDSASSDLGYIKNKGTMIIGITDYEPMDYQDENGDWTGFDAEVAKAVCEMLGVTPVFQEVNWSAKESELASKTIDCIWNALTVDEERAANMGLTDNYMVNKQVIVVRASDADKYTDIDSLASATFVAEGGSAGEGVINELFADATYVDKEIQLDALLELKSLTADAAVIDYTMAKYLIEKPESDFSDLKILDIDIADDEYYAVAFRKGSDVPASVNGVLAELADSGKLAEIANKYGLTDALVIG